MRTFYYIIVVLVAVQSFALVASTDITTTTTREPSTESTTNSPTETTTTSTTTTAASTESNIPQSIDDETKVKVAQNLLAILGMKKRPNPIDRSTITIPDAMKQLYAELMSDEQSEKTNEIRSGLLAKAANTARSFIHEESKIDQRFVNHHHFRLYFNISGIPKHEKLKAAELELFRDSIFDGDNQRLRVFVFDIIRPGIKGKTEPISYLMNTQVVHTNTTEKITIDVMPAVERWLQTPKDNYGILIQIAVDHNNEAPEKQHIRLKRSVEEPTAEWAKKQPILMTYTDDGRNKDRAIRDATTKRGKREGRKRPHKSRESRQCQRKPLYVNFETVGWSDWIVAPVGYDAYYCQGECNFPFADHMNTTNHAVVQTLVNSINSDLAPKACCVPTQLNSISMLYLDDKNKVVLKSYQDMEVVGCGCR